MSRKQDFWKNGFLNKNPVFLEPKKMENVSLFRLSLGTKTRKWSRTRVGPEEMVTAMVMSEDSFFKDSEIEEEGEDGEEIAGGGGQTHVSHPRGRGVSRIEVVGVAGEEFRPLPKGIIWDPIKPPTRGNIKTAAFSID